MNETERIRKIIKKEKKRVTLLKNRIKLKNKNKTKQCQMNLI